MRMKQILLVLLIAMSIVLGACGADSDVPREDNTEAPADAPAAVPDETLEATPTPTPTTAPTTAPDFSGTDFTGRWRVAEVVDSNGETVGESEMQALDAGFAIELLEDGVYFVYDGSDAVLGQGEYSIAGNQLTLTASEQETVYEIRDKDTLWCESADKSVTVMHRAVDDNTEPEDQPDNTDGEDSEDDADDADDASEA